MNNKNLIILLCSLVLTCACINKTNMSKPVTVSNGGTKNNTLLAATSKQDHGMELLAFIENYSALAPDAQKKIFSETTQALAENKNDLRHRIRLASMLALPGSYARDNAKAQAQLHNLILENIILNPADLALVNLLHEYTTDNAKQSQKHREESKKLDSIQQKYGALEQKNEALEQKNKELEQKLYELKNIEKTMSERGAKPSN